MARSLARQRPAAPPERSRPLRPGGEAYREKLARPREAAARGRAICGRARAIPETQRRSFAPESLRNRSLVENLAFTLVRVILVKKVRLLASEPAKSMTLYLCGRGRLFHLLRYFYF